MVLIDVAPAVVIAEPTIAHVPSIRSDVKNSPDPDEASSVNRRATRSWLNAKGRASAKAQGMNLKAPVRKGDNPRRASFLARMGGMPGPEYKDGKPTRLLLSLRAWGASSKADARRKAKNISKPKIATPAHDPIHPGATTSSKQREDRPR